jgi:putative membrane protein
MIELFLSFALGSLIGVVAGLLPGLHPNNVVPIVLGMSFIFGPLPTAIILLSTGVINSFINFIPSILLGAPEDSNVLGVLPGHKLLMQGRGYEAIKLCVTGCFGGIIFSVATLPLFALIIPPLYGFIRPNVQWLLIFVVTYMIVSESWKERVYASFVFLLSGILGLVVLNNFSDSMLFPLLTGLFGLPMLILSVFEKSALPEKLGYEEDKINRQTLLSCIGVGGLAGIVAGFLPGVGSTQSTILTQQLFKKKRDERSFLISIGAITSSDIVYSILSLWLIGNPRSGIAVGISKLIEVGFSEVMIFIAFILVSAGVATVLSLALSKFALRFLKKIDYQKLCLASTAFLLALTVIFSGFVGLLVITTSLSVGMIANKLEIKRTYAMGCLLLPTILFFLSFNS